MAARQRSPLYQWEQDLINAFYDYQWHLVLDPLYEQFQRWKVGAVSHLEMDKVIHKTHKACQQVYNLFTNEHDFLVSAIQLNEAWFPGWAKEHPKPIG